MYVAFAQPNISSTSVICSTCVQYFFLRPFNSFVTFSVYLSYTVPLKERDVVVLIDKIEEVEGGRD